MKSIYFMAVVYQIASCRVDGRDVPTFDTALHRIVNVSGDMWQDLS